MATLRPAASRDIPAIVALNAAAVELTSPMDEARCRDLIALSRWCIVALANGEVAGFVLAMTEDASYDNGNFRWFADRLKRFVYIDRVMVGKNGRRQGLGGRLYDTIADAARADGCLLMAAEMYIDPPNAASLGFHAGRGFAAIGSRRTGRGATVSMQICGL